MILNKEVDIRIGNKEQMEYYSKLGYQLDWKRIITVKVDHLMLKSNVKLNVRCDVCRVEKRLIYSKYTKNTKNLTEDYCCSNKCAMTKQENTCLEKYGVKYPAKDKEIFKKTEQTKLEKYGDKYYTNREKSKNTCLEKYGFESSNSDESIKEKMRKTLFENYGVYHPTQNGEIFSKSQRNSFKIHTYNNTTIEIKSSWTYNRNNKDELLQLKNETRWQTVRDLGDDIVILKSKEEIKNYVDNIVYNIKK